jgi:hypothetical protein
MASSQHTPSYTRQPQQPPIFETADELFESIEDLIEKGLVQPFLDDNQQLRFIPLPHTEGTLNLLEHGCGTLTSEEEIAS